MFGIKDKKDVKPELSSQGLIKSYLVSLAISVPCLLGTVYLSGINTEWTGAHVIFGVILFVSVLNFIALVFLEEIKSRIGALTVPALLASLALIFLFLLIEGVSRFFPLFGYQWLFPVIALLIVFKYLAMFKEKNLALKFYLAMNILALAALWGLGKADKIDLPF